MIMIIIIDNHNHDNGNHNNDITMIIMLTVTMVTRREYFQMDICVTFVVVVLVESPLQKLNIIWKCWHWQCCNSFVVLIKMTQLKALLFMTIVPSGEYPNAHENWQRFWKRPKKQSQSSQIFSKFTVIVEEVVCWCLLQILIHKVGFLSLYTSGGAFIGSLEGNWSKDQMEGYSGSKIQDGEST